MHVRAGATPPTQQTTTQNNFSSLGYHDQEEEEGMEGKYFLSSSTSLVIAFVGLHLFHWCWQSTRKNRARVELQTTSP